VLNCHSEPCEESLLFLAISISEIPRTARNDIRVIRGKNGSSGMPRPYPIEASSFALRATEGTANYGEIQRVGTTRSTSNHIRGHPRDPRKQNSVPTTKSQLPITMRLGRLKQEGPGASFEAPGP